MPEPTPYRVVPINEWNTLIWLLAEAQFRSSQCWPKCGGYCGLPKNHAGPCYW
jgi:hypothetical protein